MDTMSTVSQPEQEDSLSCRMSESVHAEAMQSEEERSSGTNGNLQNGESSADETEALNLNAASPETADPEVTDAAAGIAEPAEPKIKTLRDYVEPKPVHSPRGIDLEQIKASPRSEDLTKIKFARFVFNGVSTTVVSRSTKHVDGSQGDLDDSGNSPAGSNIENVRSEQQSLEFGEASDHKASDSEVRDLRSREDSDDLNLAKLASLTASRPRPIPLQAVQVDDKLWLGKLKDLSRNCIKKVGSESVGQEYTVRLKAAGKELDHALREGLGSVDISRSAELEKQRWEAVQRLSAILHETHDAEVGLIHAEQRERADAEREIWKEGMKLCCEEEDAIRQRLRDERDQEEEQLRDKWFKELGEKESKAFDAAMEETILCNHGVMALRHSELREEEEALLTTFQTALDEEPTLNGLSLVGSPSLSEQSPSPTRTNTAQHPVANATPRRLTTQAQMREAYEKGSPGSLPLEYQADSPRGSRGGEAARVVVASPLSSLNFIPENSLLPPQDPGASRPSAANDPRMRFLF